MSESIVLHVGAMKSGTSFIQQTLASNRDVLLEQGFLFPGKVWRDQVLGVIDVKGALRDGRPVEGAEGAWQRLVDEMDGYDGRSLISMEFLAASSRAQIAKIVESLHGTPIEVVLTARDLGRSVPAMWQEGIQNRYTWTWTNYLDGIRNGDPGEPGVAHRFWGPMGMAASAQRWAEAVGRDHVTVVTVPPPGAPKGQLWERFCGAVGLDPAPFVMPARDNASLGAASTLLLRSVNERLAGLLTTKQYHRVVKHELAKRGMAARRFEEQTIGYHPDSWARGRANFMIERFRELGVKVVGDLEELRPLEVAGIDPGDVPLADVEAAAVASLRHLVAVWTASQTEAATDE